MLYSVARSRCDSVNVSVTVVLCGYVWTAVQHGRGAARAGLAREIWMMDHQRNASEFVVDRHSIFGPPIVFTKQETMIRGQDKTRVRPHVVGIKKVQ